MGKIDTSEWKEFKLGYIMVGNKKQGHGLFEIVNSVAYHSKDVTETDSDDGINYITRSKFNNGLKARVVRLDKFKVNPAGTISFGAENADFFYQTEPYITGNKMYYIDTTALSERACRFLKSIMEATFTANYSFSDGMIPARIYDECIKLPATPDGAPDWAYMESYMANLEAKVAESLTMLQAAKDAEKKKVDTREWKVFRIGNYFKVEYGRFHAKDELGAGKVNYITTSGFNNGITNTCEEATHQGNCITVASDGAMGASFYQEEAFTTSNIVSTLTPLPHTPLNKYNAFFLCAIIFGKRAEFGWLGFKMSVDRVRNLRVKLPSTPDGQPDWAYMGEYMRKVEEKAKNVLNHFEKDRNGV